MNNSVFTKEITLTDAMVDCFGRWKPSSLLLSIQEVSGLHSQALGAGWEVLAKKNLFWAILRTKLQITRLPVKGETVTLKTWPMPTTRVAYPRAAAAFDREGNELFRGITVWVLMDFDTRAMVLPGKSGVEVTGLIQGSELAVPTALPARTMQRSHNRRVCFTDLDQNGHMNNTRYLDWIWDLLPSDFHRQHAPREITICYLSEAREGQSLQLQWDFPDSDCLHVDIHRDQSGSDQRIFASRILF